MLWLDESLHQNGKEPMQQLDQKASTETLGRERIGESGENLPLVNGVAEGLAQAAHDARNMVTALNLYCNLLLEPGVLSEGFAHYGEELKHVAATSRRLVEKLAVIRGNGFGTREAAAIEPRGTPISPWNQNARMQPDERDCHPPMPIDNLAAELLTNRNLLTALVGPTVRITIDVEGSALPVRLATEDLTRILVNLVKNAAEAMSSVGRVHITLRESAGDSERASLLILNVEDNGPGFPDRILANIFESSEETLRTPRATWMHWPVRQRGLGLGITRSLVEQAGGRIHAANRDPVGACIQIELPVRDVDELPLKPTNTNAALN